MCCLQFILGNAKNLCYSIPSKILGDVTCRIVHNGERDYRRQINCLRIFNNLIFNLIDRSEQFVMQISKCMIDEL